MLRLLFLLSVAFIAKQVTGQELQFLNGFSENQIADYAITELQFDGQISALFNHDVEMYRMSHQMPFLDGEIEVSGAVFTPSTLSTETEYPIVVFNHGTTFVRTNAPSFKQEISNMGYLLSSLGFVVLMPDYVGLGESLIMHPYCHAESESDCGWSLVRAFIDSSEELGINTNGNLFISGYSQGGHVAMAMAKNNPPESIEDDVELIAVAPLSGPYDMSGTQLPLTFEQISYSNPAYLFYTLKGWNSVYGNIYEDFSEICYEPYASIIEPMLDGFHTASEINAECPEELTDLFPEELIQAVLSNPENLIMQLAAENDVHQWVPEMPVHMMYCTEDEEVFYQNALLAESWMNENGAQDAVAYNLGAANHNGCALSAITNSMLWFYSLNEAGNTSIPDISSVAHSNIKVYDLKGKLVYDGAFESRPNLSGIFLVQPDGARHA
ncbi:MAG: alpha/beta hydrolase family protein, partial [Flavobacteriales bacterium]